MTTPGKATAWVRPTGRTARSGAALVAGLLLGTAALAVGGAGRAGAAGEATSYEGVASAEGVRVSVSAPNFVAVDTFVDGGGPVSQAVIDGLGNSHAFASLPYPGDLAISGPGLLAGLTGLPSPPPYPFYVDSSYPTKNDAKLAQPGYELVAHSAEAASQATATTGGASSGSAIGSTVTRATTGRDAASGAVTAEATGTADIVNVGGVLRIGQVDALAKVTRSPGADPVRAAHFAINGMTIAGQTVGFSDKGFTFAGTQTPIPAGTPLLEALEQAKISVAYLGRIDNPDGVVSPGLVVTQQQQIPSGPTMVVRYVFGQMSASASVSGSSTSIGSSLPAETGSPAAGPVVEGPSETAPPTGPTTVSEPAGAATTDTAGGDDVGGSTTTVAPQPAGATAGPATTGTSGDVAVAAPAVPPSGVQLATPIAQQPVLRVDTLSIYVILVVGALVALGGGLLLRLVGVKLKWVS